MALISALGIPEPPFSPTKIDCRFGNILRSLEERGRRLNIQRDEEIMFKKGKF